MNSYTKYVQNHNGEGVILRKPGSVYENGRSMCLVKYKVYIPTTLPYHPTHLSLAKANICV